MFYMKLQINYLSLLKVSEKFPCEQLIAQKSLLWGFMVIIIENKGWILQGID
jgi:hypothetical protein